MSRCLALLAASILALTAAEPLRVHLGHGLWHQHYRLDEALAHLGGAIVDHSWGSAKTGSGWPSPARQGDGWLGPFPDADGLAACHLLIGANIHSAALCQKERGEQLVAWIEQGGVLVLLGGRFALGEGHAASPLATLGPFTITGGGRFGSHMQHAAEGLALAATDAAPAALRALDWRARPRVFWRHETAAAAGDEVWLTAAGEPILAVRRHGAGAVAIFAGSVMGEGEGACWRWDDWPRALAATCDALLGERIARGRPAPAAKGSAPAIDLAGAWDPSAYPDVQTDEHRAYQRALLAALAAGDTSHAPALVEALRENLRVEARAAIEKNKPQDKRQRAHQARPALLAFQLEAYAALNDLPAASRAAVATAIVEREHRLLTDAALALGAGRELSAAERATFARSTIPAIHALGAE